MLNYANQKKEMNCKQANEKNIAGFLMSKGINPNKPEGNNFWYCSPLRNEKEPSFKVCRVKNVWYDYGTGTGGRLVDLVCKMYNVNVPRALLILSGITVENTPLFSSDKQKYNESQIELKHIQPLQNQALIQYLSSRKINPVIAAKYCKEAYYKITNNEKQYFSIAFENDSNGFELRNKYFKGSTSPKDITTIPGKNHLAVNVFEGFMDFISALTFYNSDCSACDTIVLNGVGFIKKFINLLPNYTKINLYLDTDKAGQEAAKRIQELRPEAVNRSQIIYPQYKDFNEFIINQLI
jgi:DNA primase